MPRAPWVGDAVYAAGERFVAECLRQDGSLLTPGRAIWTPGTLDDFHERYVVHEKTEGGSFMERLQEQLEGAPDETIQLTAETLSHQLPLRGRHEGRDQAPSRGDGSRLDG